MDGLENLTSFLQYTKQSTGLHITISGLSLPGGLTKGDALLPHVWHVNPFCLFIKSRRHRWDQCICAKEVLLRSLRVHKTPVSGYCPFGVWERSWPILLHDRVVGAVSASAYQGEIAHARTRWHRTLPREEHLKSETLYQKHMTRRDALNASAECTCQLICEHLTRMAILGEITFSAKEDPMDQLIHRAMDYMRIHLHEPVAVREVAQFCNVSESHLQHLFHRRRRQGMVQTLTALRMEKAAHILSHSSLSIAETAAACGFTDPNYFSIVFSRQMGISPKKYRVHQHSLSIPDTIKEKEALG